jgi:predicted TIM-barrel fold metal-dependent hydrolase
MSDRHSSDNPAFEAARALGIVDTFLAMPKPREKAARTYDFIRRGARDRETQAMEMPAEYMFKGVPKYDEIDDPVELVLAQMDHYGIEKMLVGIQERTALRAYREHPDRFLALWNVDPNDGMDAVRELEEAHAEHRLHAAHTWGTGSIPQVPIDDRRMYPLYAKCVELDLPMVLYVGFTGPRLPTYPQEVERLDEVCWFFPELTIVCRHGGEPWTQLMVKLLLKWPNLYWSSSAFAPRYYPRDVIDFANTRGADKVMYAGYYAAGLGLDRIFDELPQVPLRDHVWPKFLRENALAVFDRPRP